MSIVRQNVNNLEEIMSGIDFSKMSIADLDRQLKIIARHDAAVARVLDTFGGEWSREALYVLVLTVITQRQCLQGELLDLISRMPPCPIKMSELRLIQEVARVERQRSGIDFI